MIPIILAIGAITLAIVEFTSFFDIIGIPFGYYLELFGLPSKYAPAMLTGFIDVFIPALTLVNASLQEQFIIGALSVVQIIYITEVGILILKSKIPLNIFHLLSIFLIRTIIALPIIFGLTWLLTNIL
jgi:nucleoside recognition membrane protein YjiH